MKFTDLIEHFGDRPLFELREVLALSADSEKSLKNQLSAWTQNGKLMRLRRGVYLLGTPYRKQTSSAYYASNHENEKLSIKLEVDWEDIRQDVEPFVLRAGSLRALRRDLLISELVEDN